MNKPRNHGSAGSPRSLLGLGLSLTPAFTPARSRPGTRRIRRGAAKKGRPLDGYLATITLMLLALFLVGKSARR